VFLKFAGIAKQLYLPLVNFQIEGPSGWCHSIHFPPRHYTIDDEIKVRKPTRSDKALRMNFKGLPSILFLLLFLSLISSRISAQEESSTKTVMVSEMEENFEDDAKEESRHFIGIMIAHDHVSQGIKDG